MILNAPKQILYETGSWVVARWPVKRVLKLSYSFLVKNPLPLPKNGKRSFCLKVLFRKFQLFSSIFFLVEKLLILIPPPPFSRKFYYFVKPSPRHILHIYFFGCVGWSIRNPASLTETPLQSLWISQISDIVLNVILSHTKVLFLWREIALGTKQFLKWNGHFWIKRKLINFLFNFNQFQAQKGFMKINQLQMKVTRIRADNQ